jgi:hypothetical protein
MAVTIRVYVEGKLLAEGEVPGPLVAMPAKTPKKGGKRG